MIMFGRKDKKQNQKGSLLIEAMAMLGLIAMVTPMLYKKAAERTNELQDINAASQMRVLSNAIDSYLRDNYDKIVTNETVKSNCDGAEEKKYNFSGDDSNETIPVAHLCEYLPYGFSEKTMMFSDVKIGLKRRNFTSATGGSVVRQDLTALVVATPTSGEDMPRVRASRIASMIGTNGGLADNKVGYGVQGVWKIELNKFDSTDFKPSNAVNNSVLVTSIEAIASGNHGREDVLHRNKVDEDGVMNTMNTTLYMGSHPIKDVQQMIVTGDGLGELDDAILLEDGSGVNIESGNLHVGGNTTLDGTLDVGGDANFGANVTVAGLLKALQVEVTDWLKAGSAEILGQFSAAGGMFTVEAGTGNTNIGGTLNVAGDTTLQSNLSVEGTSNLKGKTTIGTGAGSTGDPDDNVVLEVKGDAKFEEDIYVAGVADVDNLNVRKVFQAGLDDSGEYNFYADKGFVDIVQNNFRVGSPDTGDTGFKITEDLTKIKNGTKIEMISPQIVMGSSTNPSMLTVIENDGVSVNQEDFKVTDSGDNTLFEVNQSSKEVRVKGGADFIVRSKGTTDAEGNTTGGDLIFQVDQDGAYQTAERGASVYVRKGVIELGRNSPSDVSDKSQYTGYVKLDRIVANQPIDENAFHDDITDTGYSGVVKYDEFQVNPAYTSVMHDIKLTTRGGARLSDILPDFINKGIYVLDGTYKERLNGKSVNWDTDASGTPVAASQFPYNISSITSGGDVMSAIRVDECEGGSGTAITDCPATPWLGFIPAPTCPPGYLKVATLAPIRWAMAQAGLPIKKKVYRADADDDEILLSYNRDPSAIIHSPTGEGELWRRAYTFQQSTWLNTSLKAFTTGGISYGWSGIIGFIYPALDYAEYLEKIGEMRKSDIDGTTIVWNLFEVYNLQVVGIANVYCYFNRRSQAQLDAVGSTSSPDFKNDELIDRYDQLTGVRVRHDEKDDAYVERLNDPKLKYTDPW